MLEITETSRRTLYRDLEKLENSLPSIVQLRTSDNGYSLIGDLSQLTKVRKLIEYTMTERLTGELLLLIEQKASILSLTEQFAISQPTATSDLKKLEGMLKANGICLERDKGLKIKGNEEKIRSVLVSSLNSASQVSEILTGEIGKNKVLSLIPMEYYEYSRKVFSEIRLPEMTDRTKAMMQLFFTTSLLRLHQKNTVSTENLERLVKLH